MKFCDPIGFPDFSVLCGTPAVVSSLPAADSTLPVARSRDKRPAEAIRCSALPLLIEQLLHCLLSAIVLTGYLTLCCRTGDPTSSKRLKQEVLAITQPALPSTSTGDLKSLLCTTWQVYIPYQSFHACQLHKAVLSCSHMCCGCAVKSEHCAVKSEHLVQGSLAGPQSSFKVPAAVVR